MSMSKEAFKGKGILKALAAGGAIGGAGYGGAKFGEKKGKKELAGKFNAYNKKENKMIGSAAYRKGAQDAYTYFSKRATDDGIIEAPSLTKEVSSIGDMVAKIKESRATA